MRTIFRVFHFFDFIRSSLIFVSPNTPDSGPTALRQLGPHRGHAQRLGRAESLKPEPDPDLYSRSHRDHHHQIHFILRRTRFQI